MPALPCSSLLSLLALHSSSKILCISHFSLRACCLLSVLVMYHTLSQSADVGNKIFLRDCCNSILRTGTGKTAQLLQWIRDQCWMWQFDLVIKMNLNISHECIPVLEVDFPILKSFVHMSVLKNFLGHQSHSSPAKFQRDSEPCADWNTAMAAFTFPTHDLGFWVTAFSLAW